MTLAYDLHIHSCVSPCGDEDMTPNNIVNMAYVKGLDVIAVTDHNTAAHVRAASEVARSRDMLLIPGMEIQTREEVHVLCYFPSVMCAEQFDTYLEAHRSKMPNSAKLFGHQTIRDSEDTFIGEYPYALIASVDLGLDHLIEVVGTYGGVSVPAHVNKPANSILSHLGFISPSLGFHCIEVYEKMPVDPALIDGYCILHNSDAHYLEHIHEPQYTIEVEEKSILAVLNYLRGKAIV